MKFQNFTITTFLIVSILVSCVPSSDAISHAIEQTQDAWTAAPTLTTLPPIYIKQTVVVVHTIVVTVTATDTPPFTLTSSDTPTITPTSTFTPTSSRTATPTRTATPRPTLNALTADHFSGVYGVGIDIAPGRWEVREPNLLLGAPDCYWARYNAIGNVIEDDYGQSPPFIIIVAPSDTLVEFDRCGKVVYLGR